MDLGNILHGRISFLKSSSVIWNCLQVHFEYSIHGSSIALSLSLSAIIFTSKHIIPATISLIGGNYNSSGNIHFGKKPTIKVVISDGSSASLMKKSVSLTVKTMEKILRR